MKKRTGRAAGDGKALGEYARKRDFAKTPEPPAQRPGSKGKLHFVVQQHAARRMHWDFRLEHGGVLKSWAVPKGPSLDPGVKRMAIETEDHPIAYADFEGVIPKGEYGAGTVIVWDRGAWTPIHDATKGLAKGHLEFTLAGEKLRGRWHLVRMKGPRADRDKKMWLLIKGDDAYAQRSAELERLRQPLPAKLEPQLATLVDVPSAGGDWIHEIKLDGYRLLARIEAGAVKLFTRSGNDWTDRFAPIAKALSTLGHDAWIDGEVVVLDGAGRSRFQLLQNALDAGRGELVFCAFDLPWLDGFNLRDVPLLQRKEILAQLLGRPRKGGGPIRLHPHAGGSAAAAYAAACQSGEEGILSKRADAPYRSGRTRTWTKRKCGQRQEFVVVGYTEPKGTRVGIGALLLAVYDDAGTLRYAGKVGTGFSDALLAKLRRRLEALRTEQAPVVDPRRAERGARWVSPELVAEVSFTEWTDDDRIRHPAFLGIREDKRPMTIRREEPQRTGPAKPAKATATATGPPPLRSEVAGIRLSNPDRVYYPDSGITKSEVAQYYEAMAERVVPAMAERPLSLVRCPQGCEAKCFYQKHAAAGVSERVGRVAINPGEEPYTKVIDLASIIALVQYGVLEFHVWGARADAIEKPDQLVFDLDPDPSVAWKQVADTARVLRAWLTELGLVPFLRTTGGKGLHIVVPIQRRSTWDDAKGFTHDVALRLVKEAPAHFTATLSKRKREGKILIDYLRNQRDATAIASYSLRARAGAPVAMPIAWEELDEAKQAMPLFQLRSARARLDQPDPWRDFETSRRALTKTMRKRIAG